MRRRAATLLVWSLWSATVVLASVGVAVQASSWVGWGHIPWLVDAVAFSTLGLVVVLRRRHRIGWLLAMWGLVLVPWGPILSLGGDSPASSLWWVTGVVLFPTLLLLLFPDGRLPSTRWRWLLGAAALPIFPGSEKTVLLAGALFLVTSIGAVAAPVVRFRRSHGLERQQIKWLAAVPIVALAVMTPFWVLENMWEEGPWLEVGEGLALLTFAAAIAVAVLRYRLYEIDVVISKTVVFAGLAGFITAVYVGIVVGVGALVGAGDESNLGLSIVATAVVAVAFQPARERLTRLANRLVYGRRATPYEVLSRFSSHIGETVATEQTLQHMARLLAEGTGAWRAQVWLKVGEQMRSAASWPEDAVPDFAPLILADGSLPQFADVDLAVPVSHDGELLGALTITKKRGEPITPTERNLVDDLASQAGLVVRNVGLTAELRQRLEELRDSRRRLVSAQDQERRRLERDLHDGAQQQLVALKVKLNVAKNLAERDGATQVAALVDQLAADNDEAVQTLRELAHGIYPPLLAAEGLQVALQAHARKAPLPVTVEAEPDLGRFPQEIEAAVYFCVLEAIQNAVKYAAATAVTITITQEAGELAFSVVDDGQGFDPATAPRGQGLHNMADRLDALAGSLQIQSRPGSGTSVYGRLPLALTEPRQPAGSPA